MAKKKIDKEEKALNTWIPIGLMIGTMVGIILSSKFNNVLYFGGITGGLLIGTLLGTIATEKIEITKKKKKK